MYIVIAGSGILGFYTAQFLIKKRNDVVIIEEDKDRAEEITDKLDATVIHGDAKEIKTLQDAGIEQTDVFLAMTGSDETNILVSILAKQLGAKRVVCRITHIEYSQALFKKLGIDAVVYPELTIATQIEEMVRDPDISGFALLDDGETEMVEIRVAENSKLAGSKISKIRLPGSSQVVSIVKPNNEREAAFSESIVKGGDKVLVLTNKDEIDEVEKIFSK
jgi:trk system potassium uptake protein TrkA